MKRLFLIIAMGLIVHFLNAQNAPTSTYQGAIVIDKPVPGGIGLKVEGGRTWLHNDDNGANSEVLDLGINKNWNAPTIRILTSDGGGWNGMQHYATRWGTNFSWSRGSSDGLQLISTFGGADGNHGNYMRIYGISPDTARVVKILLRSKNNSYINTNGNFGLGTNVPTAKLDVDGKARIRTLPSGGDYVVTSDANGNLMRQSYIDFVDILSTSNGDNLGNHFATMNLDMRLSDINNATNIYTTSRIRVGTPGLTSATTIQQNSIEIDQIGPGPNILKLNTGANKNDIDSQGNPLVLNDINNENVGIGGLPDLKLDVYGRVKIRDLPFGELPFITTDPNGVLHHSNFTPLDFAPDHLGNHCAEKDLDMKGFSINNVQDINGFNMNINAVGGLNIHSNDFLHLTAANGITLDAPKNTKVGIGKAPDADVYLSVNGTTRIKDLPEGYFPVVTADDTGKLHQWPIELLDGGDPGGGYDCDFLQIQIDDLQNQVLDLLNRVEQLENE